MENIPKDSKILIEENGKLTQFFDILKKKINYLIENKPYPSVSRYSVGYDYEDREDLNEKKKQNEEAEKKINYLSYFQDKPYFGRMDLQIQEKVLINEQIYIGNKSLVIDNNQMVIDWRSPIGGYYYQKSKIEFEYHNNIYILMLRRMLIIKNHCISDYNDEYIYGEEIFKDGITDPFLINVLREKKNEYKLTDIIKTIQQNQNDMIRFDIKKSFIVQGCAGSGKTMILLHRLSQIIFNRPNSNHRKIKIITPSDTFNAHINNLCRELEIDMIERYTINEYYINLLNLYGLKKWEKIYPNSKLDSTFIKNVYSKEFYTSFVSQYTKFINTLYINLAIIKANEICFAHGLQQENVKSNSDRDLLKNYFIYTTRVIEENNKLCKKVEEIKGRIVALRKELEEGDYDSKRHSQIINKLDELTGQINALYFKQLSNNELDFFYEKQALAQSIKFIDVYSNTIQLCLNRLYEEHNISVPKVKFEYHLYLALQCCILFEGGLSIQKKDGFLNIDEGQDLAPTEYKMLQEIHGDSLIVNIYGDVNQTISSKGTCDWGDVVGIHHLFKLNENYRNTDEITKFCNKELGLSVTSIGVLGARVQYISIKNTMEEIKKVINKNCGRCAVIANENKITQGCQLLFEKEKCNKTTISILTIEEAKGLEFEIVFVFDEGMSKNEKYIAYTRALEELFIVRTLCEN